MADGNQAYEVTDTLFLWWLRDPAAPVLIGELRTARALRGVSLRYAPTWLAHGVPLSEDLPLQDALFLPASKDRAPGAVDDARPDRWGERLIRCIDRPPRLSLLEYLYFAGDDRFGALGVSTSAQRYAPRQIGLLPQLADVPTLHALTRKVLAGEGVSEADRRLLQPGVTMGGARPKALLALEGAAWVLKFAEPGDVIDIPLVEHASMLLAAQAGITVAPTRALALPRGGHAVAVQRFDRLAGGRRLHAQSAGTALLAAGEELGYPELAQWLRRRGGAPSDHHPHQLQRCELFRRMVFNILIDNTDDHEKNHALLTQDAQSWWLSPAFDVLPSGQALGYQQMRVGTAGAESSLDNALSMCSAFGLSRDQAVAEARTVAAVVDDWQPAFRAAGVSPTDIAQLAEQLDRPFLRAQRVRPERGRRA
ncbi:MAG: type II toxin-antitoxin system HipA family toxin [Leptothrix ochracea]|uniref:type II toxin-antitoxin system HipA family toxin n=1 Tax=Leptothrix ochracea TaxID=735331 RepID=UPI0034E2E5E2